ncbi:PREDICTED: uncharacterized protein LOC106820144, partial [Priapulus caudatus]|uniref:Uncharacterized protein LOC106820144 n=1 Tax=Priapulus caudatus TaxID=37621 RepID=A0ABM1F6V6_PRICU
MYACLLYIGSAGRHVQFLREVQVAQLQEEIRHPHGVKLKVRRSDAKHNIAFVELLGAIWIAGWRQRQCPQLHNAFHIGDRLVLINRMRVASLQDVQRALKRIPDDA